MTTNKILQPAGCARNAIAAFAISAAALITSTAASAAPVYENPAGTAITRLGVNASGYAQVDFASAPASSTLVGETTATAKLCHPGIYFVTLGSPGGRAMYNTLVAAQLANKKVRYIYADVVAATIASGNTTTTVQYCYLSLLELVP